MRLVKTAVMISWWLFLSGQALSDDSSPTPGETFSSDLWWSVLESPIRAVKDVPDFFVHADPRKNPGTYAFLTGLTGAFLILDQPILDESQRFAKQTHLITQDDDGRKTRVIAHEKIFGIGAEFHIPISPNTYMYYLGDGITTITIAGGLLTYGAFGSNNRAVATASQMLEAIALTGMFIITGKMSTGREAPFRSTENGGKWRGFVGFKRYLGCVSRYDAFPSGHIATAMTTVRILVNNYSEIAWLAPVGYSAMGLLMFSMLNNGVHWASDFPLGIAIGYNAATVVLEHHHKLPKSTSSNAPFYGITLTKSGDYLVAQKTWLL